MFLLQVGGQVSVSTTVHTLILWCLSNIYDPALGIRICNALQNMKILLYVNFTLSRTQGLDWTISILLITAFYDQFYLKCKEVCSILILFSCDWKIWQLQCKTNINARRNCLFCMIPFTTKCLDFEGRASILNYILFESSANANPLAWGMDIVFHVPLFVILYYVSGYLKQC